MKEWSPCWKKVRCENCKEEYICTPQKDYYNSTNAIDGLCLKCLMEGKQAQMVVAIQPSPELN